MKRVNEKNKREKEERDKKNCLILGIADLSSKNSARDFIDKAREKDKHKMKQRAGSSMKSEVDIKDQLDQNKEKFNEIVKFYSKEISVEDRRFEDKFYEEYCKTLQRKEELSALAIIEQANADKFREPGVYGGRLDDTASS